MPDTKTTPPKSDPPKSDLPDTRPLSRAERKRLIAEADALHDELATAFAAMTPDEAAATTRRVNAHLRAAGYTLVEDVAADLGVTDRDMALIEAQLQVEREHDRMRKALSRTLRAARRRAGLTQAQIATRIQSVQAHISLAEAAQETVSLDLMLRAALASGATAQEIGQALAG